MFEISLQALKKYAVFYKLELSDASSSLPQLLPELVTDNRRPGESRDPGLIPRSSRGTTGNLFDIQRGIPRIYPQTSGMFLPHDINLDQLDAISFDKGCYTGQEIIARMHYRAKLKTRMFSATVNIDQASTDQAPQPGKEDNSLNGTIVDAAPINNKQYFVLFTSTIKEAATSQ